MFPQHVTEVLQQLSYLALIVSAPCILYFAIKMIILDVRFESHVKLDETNHSMTQKHLGVHDSKIHDLEIDNAARNGHLK